MSKAKKYLILFAILFSTARLQAQKDSIQSIFKPIHLGIHYSNLQWEAGYSGFVFNHVYLNALSLDFFGIVFNDVNFAFGIDEAGGRGGNYRGPTVVSTNVQSYSDFYLKIEPMLFPDKLFNISMPVKFAESTLSYPDTSTATIPTGGYGRRNRRPTANFFSITPGVFGYVNVFPHLNLGMGVAYRFAFSEGSMGNWSDYNNFSFSVLARIRLAFRHKHKAPAANKDDYYKPDNRFQ